MKSVWLAIIVALLSTGPQPALGKGLPDKVTARWDQLVKKHVRPTGGVDYAGLSRERAALLRRIAEVRLPQPRIAAAEARVLHDRARRFGVEILEAQAVTEAATATRVTDFMVELFETVDPEQALGREIPARRATCKCSAASSSNRS